MSPFFSLKGELKNLMVIDNEIKIHIIERIGKVGVKVDRCDGV